MPLLNGLETTRQILKVRPQTKVLILTMHESDSLIRDIPDVGAWGYGSMLSQNASVDPQRS
jgi:DNA-binding NarL/FixJ family response regulator